jgi:hypothetical protein
MHHPTASPPPPDFHDRPFPSQARDLDRRPGREGLAHIPRADGAEEIEVVAQADMVSGHLDDCGMVQPGQRQNFTNLVERRLELSLRVGRHAAIWQNAGPAGQEHEVTLHHSRRKP